MLGNERAQTNEHRVERESEQERNEGKDRDGERIQRERERECVWSKDVRVAHDGRNHKAKIDGV